MPAGVPLMDAFVRLRVDGAKLKADTEKGVEEGVGAADVTGAGAKAAGTFSSGFTGQLRKGSGEIGKAGSEAGQAWGANFGSQVGKFTSMAAKLGVAAWLGIGYASVKSAVDFQTEMKKVQTQAGAAGGQVRWLSQQILDLGGKVQQSPLELAQAMYHLKSVGLDDAAAMKALAAASNLAAVGGAGLEETTSAVAAAWRSGIKGAHDFNAAAGTVNAIIGAGNMRMHDFIDAMSTGILPAARTFGVSMVSVGSAIALLTDEGVPANVAATRLRMTLSLMGAPSKTAALELSSIGLSSTALAKAMMGPGGLVGAMGLLKKHLDDSKLSAVAQAQVLSHAFGGGRSSSAIMTLLNNYDVLVRKQKQIVHSLGDFPAAVVAQRKTVQAQWDLIKSSLDTLAVRIGDALLPRLAAFLGWVSKSHVLIPALLTVMGLLTAAIVAQAVAWAATPMGEVAIAVTALTAGIVLLYQHWAAVWGWVKAHSWEVAGALMALLGPFGLIAAAVVLVASHFRALKNAAVATGHAVRTAIDWVIARLRVLKPAAKLVFDGVTTIARINLLVVEGLFLAFYKLYAVILKAMETAWKWLFSTVLAPVARWLFQTVLYPVARWLFSQWAILVTGVWRDAIHPVFSYIAGFGKWVFQTVLIGTVKAFWTVISTVFGWIIHGAAEAFGWVPGLGGKLRQAARAFDSFRDEVNNAIGGINGKTVHVGVGIGVLTPAGQSSRSKSLLFQAAGGAVRGPGGPTADIVPAMLSAGEYVVSAGAVAHYGTDMMDAINARRFAGGGQVTVDPVVPSQARIVSQINSGVLSVVRGYVSAFGAGAGAAGPLPAGPAVRRWAPLVLAVLAMLRQPASALGTVLAQIATESGGDPLAINLTDANAAAGDPSRGLLQTIMATFLAYAGPFARLGIYSPLANIYAGLNYAIHRYGPGWTGVLGHGHGYRAGGPVEVFDNGGVITEPVWGVGRSGQQYAFALNGRAETVTPAAGGGGVSTAIAALTANGDVVIQDPSDIAAIQDKLSWAVTTKGAFG